MTFANPIAWSLLLLAIPIVLFYVFRIRLRSETVATSIFWDQVFQERRFRSFWRRLRHFLSLLLNLIFLALLVGAVADPVFDSFEKTGRRVIVVDHSASMNVRPEPGRETRLEQAKSELRRLLETTDSMRPTALLTAGGEPRIVTGFTDHPGTLRRAVDAIEPTDSVTRLVEAVERAERMFRSGEERSILIFTDGCAPGLSELSGRNDVHFFPVGSPVDNSGITRFQARRSAHGDVDYELLVEAVHHGARSVRLRLEIELDGRPVDVIPWTLEPNRPETKIVRGATSHGGLLRGTLKPVEGPADPFPTDDTAVAFLPHRRTQRIFLYGDDDLFLRKALESQSNLVLHSVSEVPQRLSDDEVFVAHRAVPEKIPRGNVLIVDPRHGCDLFDVGEPLELPIVAAQRDDSPLLKFVRLDNLVVPGARKLTPKPSGISDEKSPVSFRSLAETPDGDPIYALVTRRGDGNDNEIREQKTIVLTADLRRSDLAWRTAFPILVSQALNLFRGEGGEWEPARSTGESFQIPVATARDRVLLRSPLGSERFLPVESGSVSLGNLPECGVWTILDSVTGTELDRRACNLADVAESNLRLAPPGFYERKTEDAALREALRAGNAPVRFWLAVVALLLTTTEWFLYQRRWID